MAKKRSQIIIRKSNKLVEAKYRLDIWEMRVFTKALSMIKKGDDDFKEYRIYLSDIIKEFGLVKGLSYKYLRDGAESLNDRTIRIVRDTAKGKRVFKTKIVAGVDSALEENNDEALYIDVSFHPKLKEDLLALKSEFTTYDIRNVVSLPSSYSYRVYELLKQYEVIGRRKFELEELKHIVGAIETFDNDEPAKDHYPLYGNFRQKVLLKAQRDLINHTDISFTFEPIKRGRKVVEITFYISKNQPKRYTQKSPGQPKKYHIFDEIEPTIKTWPQRPDRELIAKLLNQGKTDDHIRKAVQYTQRRIESRQKVANPIAYFITMVDEASKQGDLFDTDQLRAKEKQEKEDKRKQTKALIVDLEREKIKLTKQADKIRDKIRDKILSENPELLDEVIEQNKKKYKTWWDDGQGKEQNLARPTVKGIISGALAQKFPKIFEELTPTKEKIEQIENEISKLS